MKEREKGKGKDKHASSSLLAPTSGAPPSPTQLSRDHRREMYVVTCSLASSKVSLLLLDTSP